VTGLLVTGFCAVARVAGAALGLGAPNPKPDDVANEDGGAEGWGREAGVGAEKPNPEDVANDEGGDGRDCCPCPCADPLELLLTS
jgi:hypothetical protein